MRNRVFLQGQILRTVLQALMEKAQVLLGAEDEYHQERQSDETHTRRMAISGDGGYSSGYCQAQWKHV